MLDDIVLKAMSGEDLTEEERKELKARNFRYELIRTLYMEKMRALGVDIKNFHFTPGEKWMEVPVFDMLSSLVKIHEDTVSGKIKPLTPEQLSQM